MSRQWSDIKGILLFSLIFLAVAFVDIFIVYGYYRMAGNFISDQPGQVHADAAIVFFGDYAHDGRSLGPDSKKRADRAVQLYREGRVRAIICVGGYDIAFWKGKPHPMEGYLARKGIPGNIISHDSLSFNTITNWEEARKIMARKRFDTVIAVSAPLHIYRISKMIGKDHVYYCAYTYKLSGFGDYWQLFKDVHREFLSRFLSFALKDRVRNRIVHIYRTVRIEVERVL